MNTLPKKLYPDAIIESLFEIRFDTVSKESLPEVLLGRLLDNPGWKGFEHRRFPIAELPPALRAADPTIKYEPIFELREKEGPRSVRIGPNVLSFHRALPYPGWDAFQPELLSLVSYLFEKSGGLNVRRLGLRYINALTSSKHYIDGLADLALQVSIGDKQIDRSLSFATNVPLDRETICTVRVASLDQLMPSPLPENTKCIVDVDVYTEKAAESTEAWVNDWIKFAHESEKEQFMGLLRPETLKKLTEKK